MLLAAGIASLANVLDLLTTYLGLNQGLHEANQTAAQIIASGTFESFALVKIIYSVAIILIGVLFYLREAHYSKKVKQIGIFVLLALSLYFWLQVAQNIALLR